MKPQLIRVTAPNPGFMTGNGTNTYIIKSGAGNCVVVDPGPTIEQHVEAIIDACGGEAAIKMIAVTHMHPDHSPAAMLLKQRTEAALYSGFIIEDQFQDSSFVAEHVLEHDQLIELDDIRLRCLYTPGHVDNHFCFLYENEQTLMTGDHMMQGSTVVIIPPQGNMNKYLASLALLKNYAITRLAPGHGDYINEPIKEIDAIIAHRLQREAKVVDKLKQCQEPIGLEQLTQLVYDDVDQQLHVMASFSLLAHLQRLQELGQAEEKESLWRIV